MIISAKFPGTCEQCGQPIVRGSLIDYVRGEPVSHARCRSDPQPKGERARQMKRARMEGGSRG